VTNKSLLPGRKIVKYRSMKTPVKQYCSTYAKLCAKLHSSFFPNDACALQPHKIRED
jgi:hypothetical protein